MKLTRSQLLIAALGVGIAASIVGTSGISFRGTADVDPYANPTITGGCTTNKATPAPGEAFTLTALIHIANVPDHLYGSSFPVNVFMGRSPTGLYTDPASSYEYVRYNNPTNPHPLVISATIGSWAPLGTVVTHRFEGPGIQPFECSQTVTAAPPPAGGVGGGGDGTSTVNTACAATPPSGPSILDPDGCARTQGSGIVPVGELRVCSANRVCRLSGGQCACESANAGDNTTPVNQCVMGPGEVRWEPRFQLYGPCSGKGDAYNSPELARNRAIEATAPCRESQAALCISQHTRDDQRSPQTNAESGNYCSTTLSESPWYWWDSWHVEVECMVACSYEQRVYGPPICTPPANGCEARTYVFGAPGGNCGPTSGSPVDTACPVGQSCGPATVNLQNGTSVTQCRCSGGGGPAGGGNAGGGGTTLPCNGIPMQPGPDGCAFGPRPGGGPPLPRVCQSGARCRESGGLCDCGVPPPGGAASGGNGGLVGGAAGGDIDGAISGAVGGGIGGPYPPMIQENFPTTVSPGNGGDALMLDPHGGAPQGAVEPSPPVLNSNATPLTDPPALDLDPNAAPSPGFWAGLIERIGQIFSGGPQ